MISLGLSAQKLQVSGNRCCLKYNVACKFTELGNDLHPQKELGTDKPLVKICGITSAKDAAMAAEAVAEEI